MPKWHNRLRLAVLVVLAVGLGIGLFDGDGIDSASNCLELEVAALAAADDYGYTVGNRWDKAVGRVTERYEQLSCDFDTYFLRIVPLRL